jgi:AraC-like DNA-binding protein
MAQKPHRELTRMEQDAIETIRRLRAAVEGEGRGKVPRPCEMVHEILRGYNGNVKLRLEVISACLGRTMRTLEREFLARYAETMSRFRERMRLEYAEAQIRRDPSLKLTALAAELGYDRETEFRRFFRRKKGESPTEFARRMRARQKVEPHVGN